MAFRTSAPPESRRRAALRAMLPKSMRKVRIIEIHRQGADSYAEESPDVFYNVSTPDDLARVLEATPKGDPAV